MYMIIIILLTYSIYCIVPINGKVKLLAKLKATAEQDVFRIGTSVILKNVDGRSVIAPTVIVSHSTIII